MVRNQYLPMNTAITQTFPKIAAGTVVALITMLIASTIALREPSTKTLLLSGIALTIVAGVGFARLMHRLDPFDGIYASSALFALIFVAKPVSDIHNGTLKWVNVDVSSIYDYLLLTVLLALVSFYAGNLSAAGVHIAKRLPSPPPNLSSLALLQCSYGLLLTAWVFFVANAIQTGGLSTLLVRREHIEYTNSNLPILSEGVKLAVPAFLLFWSLVPKFKWHARIGMSLAALMVLQTAYTGNRRYALALLAAAGAFYCIHKHERPRISTLVLSASLVFFLFIAPIELSRSSNTTYADGIREVGANPLDVADRLLLSSQSTAMLNAFGILVSDVGDAKPIPFRYGASTLMETALQPIPRALWQSKPHPIRTLIIEREWGFSQGRCETLCPTFSALGTFYSDFGIPGVIIGSLFIGIAIRIPYEYLINHPSHVLVQVAISSLVLVPVYVWWGSLNSFIISIGTGVAPLLLIGMIARTRTNNAFDNIRRTR